MAGKEPMSPGEFARYLEVLLKDVQQKSVQEYERALGLGPPWETDRLPEPFYPNHSDEHGSADLSDLAGCPNSEGLRHDRRASLQSTQLQSLIPQLDNHAEGGTENAQWHWAHPPSLKAQAVSTMRRLPSFPCSPSLVSDKRKRKLSLKESLRSNWNIHTSRWVLSPGRSRLWDSILMITLAFVALVTPVQISMMDPKLDAMFFINCVVDLVFVVDMVMQFFSVYTVKTSFGHRLEQRHSRIVVHYLRTSFMIDFLSVLPIDIVAVAMDSDNWQTARGLKIIRILRLLKMARMLKASRIIRRLESDGYVTYEGLALQKFIAVLLLVSHWLACLWAMTLSLEDGEGIPRWVDSVDDIEESVDLKTKDFIPKLYISSLYFTAYTITSVGYGDITPKNIIERIVCILILFVSGISWACVIGQVSSIVCNMDAEEQEFRRLMDNLHGMMRDRALPSSVCRRLRTFFHSAKQARKNEQQEQILRRMSPDLQSEVVLISNWYWLSQVSLIKYIMPNKTLGKINDVSHAQHFVQDIALALCSAVFAQSEIFGAPRVLYILRRGLVMTRVRSWMRVACSGAVWGEDFLLSDPRLREPEARLALTFVEVFFLERPTFLHVVHRHRRSSPELDLLIRRFTVQLSARRAVMAEARWRRFQARLEDRGLHQAPIIQDEPSQWWKFKEKKKCMLDRDECIPGVVPIAKDQSSADPENGTFKRPTTPNVQPPLMRLATTPNTPAIRHQHRQRGKPLGTVACLP